MLVCLILCSSVSTDLDSFFFNDTAPPEIYTLSLHDALPIFAGWGYWVNNLFYFPSLLVATAAIATRSDGKRSEEHTSELQSHVNLVCRLLLEKKKNKKMCRPNQTRDINNSPLNTSGTASHMT